METSTTQFVIKNMTNKERCKRWYETHKEQKKIYAEQNRQLIAEYHKKYWEEHKKNKRNNKMEQKCHGHDCNKPVEDDQSKTIIIVPSVIQNYNRRRKQNQK
jgi:hypothetical protein